MKMTLFQLLLFTGIGPFVMSATHKYYLIQQPKTWQDARVYCQATHTDLAVIKSSDDWVQLQNEAQRQSFSSEAWIGLYNDIDSWHWSFNNESLGFKSWNTGEPNNGGGHEQCVVADGNFWFDTSCAGSFPAICFDDTMVASARYIYSPDMMTMFDARTYCRQHYTDLAIIRDSIDNSEVGGIAAFAWVGLSRDSWKWINETNMASFTWGAAQPDNANQNENCGAINNGQVYDKSCSDLKPFFCYSEIRKKQTIRVKIQSQQDVNDPAVKAAILDKIKEKLIEHKMAEHTTMKWIEQPSGVVFEKEECYNNDCRK